MMFVCFIRCFFDCFLSCFLLLNYYVFFSFNLLTIFRFPCFFLFRYFIFFVDFAGFINTISNARWRSLSPPAGGFGRAPPRCVCCRHQGGFAFPTPTFFTPLPWGVSKGGTALLSPFGACKIS